jgi:hypothetical protein
MYVAELHSLKINIFNHVGESVSINLSASVAPISCYLLSDSGIILLKHYVHGTVIFKLANDDLEMIFPAFYETQGFIIVFLLLHW